MKLKNLKDGRDTDRRVAGFLILLTATLFSGCGPAESGPSRYSISGKVTYKGQPVPYGEVMFEPNGKKGNSGPAVIAVIEQGTYKTESNKGTVGGAMIVRISGLDGKIPDNEDEAAMNPHGMSLFPGYETEIDLPKESTTHDFEVPGK
tara:strand:- start:45297 stop:45740 length:444 start_codon:yes stop_codon:yes gene_type:complete